MGMKNHEGYHDPTACKAIRRMCKKTKKPQDKTGFHLTFQMQEIPAFHDWEKCLHNAGV